MILKYSLIFLLFVLPLIVSSQGKLKVEYFDGINFEKYVSSSYVDKIENYWNDDPPVDGIDPHYCSLRYTGKLRPTQTATYHFGAQVDDGIRVWIDGEMIINQWNLNDYGVFNGQKKLTAFKEYAIKVEYFNALREAEIKLMWAIKKSSEDLTWAEYFFGEEPNFEVIQPQYFMSTEPPKTEVTEDAPIASPQKVKASRPKKKIVPQPTKTQVQETQIVPTPSPQKEIVTIEKAKKFIPKNVEFVQSKDIILESSFEPLNVFAKFMIENPEFTVTIEGHTDAVGDMSLNQSLSEDRAQKIADYLTDKGVDGTRIQTIGYGGSRPLKSPAKGKYYPPNRRVVFVLEK